jgi:hypothetical protein
LSYAVTYFVADASTVVYAADEQEATQVILTVTADGHVARVVEIPEARWPVN